MVLPTYNVLHVFRRLNSGFSILLTLVDDFSFRCDFGRSVVGRTATVTATVTATDTGVSPTDVSE